jgi:hypothetical protein
MIGNYSKPARDPRFGELDTLIAEENSRKNRPLTEAEKTEPQIERDARRKREFAERALARRALRVPGIRRV